MVAFSLLATGGGAWLGAAAFTAGLVLEMLWVMWSPTPDIQLEQADCEADKENVARFSAPLMLNVLLWWATPLIINAVLARTADPNPALAAFGVVEAVAWFIAAPVGSSSTPASHWSSAPKPTAACGRGARPWPSR